MLKALELVGFKSFADKTRFEFPPGITVVVGPNGSGKSNIVDAIKWVLGEQSVKSLRGHEMADVIFNGSGSRRAQNSAETTLTFDNRERLLPIDSPEVHVTRRVYRSGEGEYLLNGQPCRLRDIRDLFAGTGVSTQAYSIIEQGKVDVLLSSSARDRRLIFEEAAGISRFRVKKVEAQRRLERVDQNLLRLSDIVEEVENRLKVVRLQAAKAKRYQGYVDRLQELRTQVGLADWRRLTEQLSALDKRLDTLRSEAASIAAQAETADVRALELERESERADDVIRGGERRLSDQRERIATVEATIEHQRTRRSDLEQEIERCRRQVGSLSTRAGDLTTQRAETSAEVEAAEVEYRNIGVKVADCERALTELSQQFDQLRQHGEAHRYVHTDLLRRSAQLASEATGLESAEAGAAATRDRSLQRMVQLAAGRDGVATELADLKLRAEQKAEELEKRQAQWHEARQRLLQWESEQVRCQEELSLARDRLTAAREREAVLKELEQRQEGLSVGAKELIARAAEATAGPLTRLRGLVCDTLRSQVDTAPLIEAALGDKAGYLIVESAPAIAELLDSPEGVVAGRVGLIALGVDPPRGSADGSNLKDAAGVLGRADSVVECDAEYAPLCQRLLGRTWFVESLQRGLELAATSDADLTFVTPAGQVVTSDGTVLAGTAQMIGGLISRRSELRALADRIVNLTASLATQQQNAQRLADQIEAENARVESLATERERLQGALANQRLAIGAHEERHSQLSQQLTSLEAEEAAALAEQQAMAARLADCQKQRSEVEAALSEAQSRLATDEAEILRLDQSRQQRTRDATLAKVELAKSEQRLDHLRARLQQIEQDQHERQRAVADSRDHLVQSSLRAVEAEQMILQAEADIASLFLEKEAMAAEIVAATERREALRLTRGEMAAEVQRFRGSARKAEAEAHQQELTAGQLRHERSALADRLREDYGIELAEIQHTETDEQQHVRAEIEEEIASLRRKITNVGSINLEALTELDDLETRFTDLSTQFRDLSGAKNSLEQIIEKINADSRRLFSETLETIRVHFQGLFRKLFGGGQADIIIEDEADPLESGLEIVARPPGKEPRSISLLSGGEKTLTCVALLLAIFRSKPSPFCVLDEVDAALDEANIGRFVSVLQEFLAWTQFIVVTHSKKTMTCAGTLYGVTMQESGISKRVSVRFEDVSETGEILRTRDEETAAGSEADEQAA